MKKRFTILIAALMLLTMINLPQKGLCDDVTRTITISSFSGLPSGNAAYNTYNWSADNISGKATIYANQNSTSMQFNADNKYFYSTAAIPGVLKSIKMTTASGTNRTYVVYGSTSAYTGSGTSYGTQIGSQTVTTSGTTFTVSSGDYTYFTIVKSGSGAGYISSIEVTYTPNSLDPSDLAITGAPVALSFDLYDNNSTQTVRYTTSSTGAITIEPATPTSYFSYVHNTAAKTITVTPLAVTPSAQTITISQAADATYAAGSKTFTVSVTDSTPFEGVIFDAAEDTGTSPIVKYGVSFACNSGVLDNGSEYRLYKNSITTFSTTDEESKITKIEFTGVSGNPASGFASQEGWTTSGNDGTWTGNATSVSFTASGAQVRATEIKVWVTWAPSTYTVTYNANGGSGTMTDPYSPYEEGDEVTLLDNAFTAPSGYAFNGWAVTDASSNTVEVTNNKFTMPASNVTVTAQWQAYTIIAQSNNDNYGTIVLNGFVITATPESGYRYATPAYTVSPANSATVEQDGDEFTVTPTANTTITINFEAIPTHTATFSVNGATTSSQSYAEGATITFPSDPANISGRKFVGWVTEAIAEPTDEEPSFVNTATETMGNSNVTYYAVFAIATPGAPVETKTQTLQYDTWTYGGTTSNQNNYRLFGNTGYVQSSAFDLSKLSKVIVYGGTYGGNSYNRLTIGDGTNTWKSVTVSGSSNTGENIYTEGSSLTGTKALYVTSNSGNASGSGVRMTKVEIFTMEPSYTYSGYCTSVVVYTITAVSNNTEYGNVTLSGEVITGSPKSGYRYASPAYTVNPANSAIVVQDGNEFTVTPLANTTITINFEAIPTYSLSSAISPVGAGTVALSASSELLEGATATATATANSGYKFMSWSITGTGATLSSTTDNPTTVTIGTANATVTANFEKVTTYAITYSVNGVTNTVNVEENTAVDLSAPSSALIPIGYAFKGWSTATLAPTDTDPNNYVTSATSTEDVTYYAVMAMDNVNYVTTHLTGDEIAANFAATAMAYADSEKTYDDTEENMVWGARCITNKDRHWIQLKSDNNVYIKAVAPQKITEVKVRISNSSNSGGGVDDITKHGDFSGDVNLDKVQNTNAGLCGTASSSAIENRVLTISADGTSNTLYIHVTASARIWNVDVTYVSINTTNFCTSVSTIDLTEDVTIDGDLNVTSYTLTIPSGKTLTVNGTLTNNTAAHLIIKDGGQLKVYGNSSKDAVEATIEKEITGFGNDNNITTGWNFIASPINVDNLAPTAVTNMLTNTYDLYQLDDTKWENYKEHEGNTAAGFSLANGRGYLYANSTDVTLSFAGAIKPFNSENPSANRVSVKAGWNLIGNPYTFDVYVNQPYYSISDAQTGITANTDASNATAIKPCTGILVYAKSIEYVEFSENEPVASTGNHGNIQMTLAHNVATRDGNRSETIDNAIVSFNEDAHLEKFYFGEPEANIYIPQNGRDYAIAFSNRQGDVPLNFKTNKISTYTISFEGEEMNLNGVYLIDMLEEEEIYLGTTPSYTFLGSPSDKAARFKIVFRNTGDDADSDIFAYQNGTDIIVSGEGELQIFDVMGRKVSSQRINGVETINVKSQGVYIMKLNEKTQKIVVR